MPKAKKTKVNSCKLYHGPTARPQRSPLVQDLVRKCRVPKKRKNRPKYER